MAAIRFVLAVAMATVLVMSAVAVAPAAAWDHPGPPPRSGHGAVFQVGAAAVDVTPPMASSGAPNPAAACATPAQLAQYDGPHLLSLEEPYVDTNHNGIWDSRRAVRRLPHAAWPTGARRRPTSAGTGSCWAGATAVLVSRRPCSTRSGPAPSWSAAAATTVSLTSVDNEGVFAEIWDQVRAKVRADGVHGVDTMLFSSTHDESAPDTIGITGPDELHLGCRSLLRAVPRRPCRPRASSRRPAHLQPATLRYGMVHPDNLVTCWSSYPFVADENIGALQARSVGDRPRHLHPGQLRHPRRGARLLVRHARTRSTFRRTGTTSPAPPSRPAMAAWPSPLPARWARWRCPRCTRPPASFDPVGVYSSSGNGGCRTIYADRFDRCALRLHRVDPGPGRAGRPMDEAALSPWRRLEVAAGSTWPRSGSSCRWTTPCSASAPRSG